MKNVSRCLLIAVALLFGCNKDHKNSIRCFHSASPVYETFKNKNLTSVYQIDIRHSNPVEVTVEQIQNGESSEMYFHKNSLYTGETSLYFGITADMTDEQAGISYFDTVRLIEGEEHTSKEIGAKVQARKQTRMSTISDWKAVSNSPEIVQLFVFETIAEESRDDIKSALRAFSDNRSRDRFIANSKSTPQTIYWIVSAKINTK